MYHLNIKNNHQTYLSIGSNIPDRLENIDYAINMIKEDNNFNIIKISSIYETEPLYYKEQNDFLNLVIKVCSSYKKHELLKKCKLIESQMGRDFKKDRYHERIIDIDILTYDKIIYKDKLLILPHPKINERKFVLVPFSEIASDYIIPGNNVDIKNLLINTKDKSRVRIFNF